MSLSINLNSAGLNAHNNMAATNTALGKSIAKLSSGYKINSASDDPAGLVISENLRAQMGGLTQAVSNSQDAVNLVKTAEGALTEVNNLLSSMRSLAVHAANAGANSSASVAADQAQIASAITSLNNISANTAFGNQKLLDGSGGQNFTVLNPSALSSATVGTGATSVFAGKTGAVNITATAATQTKLTGGVNSYGSSSAALAANDTIFVNGTKIGDFTTSNKVSDVVTAINAKKDATGVTAAFVTDHIELTSVKYGSAQTISLSESGAGISTGGSMHTGVAGADAAITAGSIGGVALTGAEIATFTTKVGNTISNAAGDTVVLATGAGGGAPLSFSGLDNSKVASMTAAASGSVFTGKSGAVNITATAATQGDFSGIVPFNMYNAITDSLGGNDTITINGTKIGDFTTADTVGSVINAINLKQGTTGVHASWTGARFALTSVAYGSSQSIKVDETGNGIAWTLAGTGGSITTQNGVDAHITAMSIGGVALTAPQLASFSIRNGNTVSNAAGDSITLANGGTGGNGIATLTGGAAPAGGTGVASLAGSALGFQIGANAGEQAALSIGSTAASKLGAGLAGNAFTDLSKIDVTANASDAIKVLDAAIAQVSTQRASLGAFQKNVLESNISSLNVTNENVAASESSIRDTDMAAEMTNFTRLNILSQAGIAMLTQSNQQPQQILSLLKG